MTKQDKTVLTSSLVFIMLLIYAISSWSEGCSTDRSEDRYTALQDSIRANNKKIDSLSGRLALLVQEDKRLDSMIQNRKDRIVKIEQRIHEPYVPKITDDNEAKRFLDQFVRER